MQIESVLQTKNRPEPAKNWFSVALFWKCGSIVRSTKFVFRPISYCVVSQI